MDKPLTTNERLDKLERDHKETLVVVQQQLQELRGYLKTAKKMGMTIPELPEEVPTEEDQP